MTYKTYEYDVEYTIKATIPVTVKVEEGVEVADKKVEEEVKWSVPATSDGSLVNLKVLNARVRE